MFQRKPYPFNALSFPAPTEIYFILEAVIAAVEAVTAAVEAATAAE